MRLLTCIFMATLAVAVLAEPAPNPARVFQYQLTDEPMKNTNKNVNMLDAKSNASTGRLFIRKLFFKKLFGQHKTPPIRPIIITGTNTEDLTDTDTPITTDTDFDTPTDITTIVDPVTTNTDTATPVTTNDPTIPTNPTDPTNPTNPTRQFQLGRRGGSNDETDQLVNEDGLINDEQNLSKVLSAGAEEFIIDDQETKDITSPKANRAPARFNLRLRGGERGQAINIRLPAKYRSQLKNGQRVILKRTKRTRPNKRHVVRRRKNRRRTNKNKNKKKNNRRLFITV